MSEVSVFDAKNRLSALLDEVERGSEIVITRRGKPVARLVGTGLVSEHSTLADEFRKLRDDIASRGSIFTWDELRALRDEGRR